MIILNGFGNYWYRSQQRVCSQPATRVEHGVRNCTSVRSDKNKETKSGISEAEVLSIRTRFRRGSEEGKEGRGGRKLDDILIGPQRY